jgi:hypothetical protein
MIGYTTLLRGFGSFSIIWMSDALASLDENAGVLNVTVDKSATNIFAKV